MGYLEVSCLISKHWRDLPNIFLLFYFDSIWLLRDRTFVSCNSSKGYWEVFCVLEFGLFWWIFHVQLKWCLFCHCSVECRNRSARLPVLFVGAIFSLIFSILVLSVTEIHAKIPLTARDLSISVFSSLSLCRVYLKLCYVDTRLGLWCLLHGIPHVPWWNLALYPWE